MEVDKNAYSIRPVVVKLFFQEQFEEDRKYIFAYVQDYIDYEHSQKNSAADSGDEADYLYLADNNHFLKID